MEVKFGQLPKNLNFEKKSFYVLFAPIFLVIAFWVWLKKKIVKNPKINFYFFDGVSKNCREVKENATKWRALDLTYNNYSGNDTLIGDFLYNFFWHNLKNAQALRNRLKLIKFLLFKNLERISKDNNEVKLISIASGSAQGVIETIFEAKQKGILVKAMLIDLDKSSLEHSKKLAQKLNIDNQITYINDTASCINNVSENFRPNIIELVGFLEYRPFDKAVRLVSSIFKSLIKGGVFLVSHIAPNLESFFLKEVINWPMIYRKPKEVEKILKISGFDLKNCRLYTEPLKIHYIFECKKL